MSGRNLSLGELIEDEVRFVKTWIKNPRKLGAVSPSSRALARLMVRQAHPDPAGYTLELGPGTGVATQALIEAGIAPERIIAVEHDANFCRLIEQRFPKLSIIHGDAFALDRTLADHSGIRFSAALSGLPLLSFPRALRLQCVNGVLDRLMPGAALIQFSYGLGGPLDPVPAGIVATKSKWVILNLPPARAWSYRRA